MLCSVLLESFFFFFISQPEKFRFNNNESTRSNNSSSSSNNKSIEIVHLVTTTIISILCTDMHTIHTLRESSFAEHCAQARAFVFFFAQDTFQDTENGVDEARDVHYVFFPRFSLVVVVNIVLLPSLNS